MARVRKIHRCEEAWARCRRSISHVPSAGSLVHASGPERLAASVPGGAATPRPRSLAVRCAVCFFVASSSVSHPPPCFAPLAIVVVASTAPARHHHSFGAVAATFVFFPILSLLLSGHGQSLLWALTFFIPIALSPRGQSPRHPSTSTTTT